MDDKNSNQKKPMDTMTQVSQKTKVGQRIGIAIAVIGVIGAAIAGSLAMIGGGGSIPGSFSLSSPTNSQTKVGTSSGSQGIYVDLIWGRSTGATSYDVYAGPPLKMVKIARVSSLEQIPETSLPLALLQTLGVRPALAGTLYGYTAKQNPQSLYNWKIVAVNSYGTRSSSTWSYTTITDFPWLQTDAGQYAELCKTSLATGKPPQCDPLAASACGGQRECDALDSTNVLDCAEMQRIWATCSSYSNKCPESLADDCMEQTVCQCNGKGPGSPECSTYLSTLANPC